MNIEQLEYVVEVAKAGSLSAASAHLHVTQSAISQSIARLEAELGVAVFLRSRTGATVTEEGKKIVRQALKVLHELNEMKQTALHDRQLIEGKLQIAAFPGLMPLLVQTIASIKKENPRLRIAIEEKDSMSIVEDIRANRTDVGLVAVYPKDIRQLNGLEFEASKQVKLVIMVNGNSPIARKKTVSPEELLKLDWVLYQDNFLDDFIADFSSRHGEPSILFTTNNAGAIQTALEENIAVTVGHDYSFVHHPAYRNGEFAMVEIASFPQRETQIGWLKSEAKQKSFLCEYCIGRFQRELEKNSL